MKATAKYIPVEQTVEFNIMHPEKVEVGDYVHGTAGDTYRIDENKVPRLVQLHAVTQDEIIKGDTVWIEKGALDCYIKAAVKHITLPGFFVAKKIIDHDLWFEYEGQDYEIESYEVFTFKVLGPLSPNATFVKDGEKYEIETIERGEKCEDPMVCLRGCHVHDGTCKWPIGKITTVPKLTEGFIQVKCSKCNTYH